MKNTLILAFLFLGLNTTYSQNTNKMKDLVQIKNAALVEYVTFLAKEGVSKEEMLKAAKSTDAILNNIKGFKHRFISIQENNTWVEVVFWESKKHADDGLKVFLAHPKAKVFLDKIKEGSVKIEYSEIL